MSQRTPRGNANPTPPSVAPRVTTRPPASALPGGADGGPAGTDGRAPSLLSQRCTPSVPARETIGGRERPGGCELGPAAAPTAPRTDRQTGGRAQGAVEPGKRGKHADGRRRPRPPPAPRPVGPPGSVRALRPSPHYRTQSAGSSGPTGRGGGGLRGRRDEATAKAKTHHEVPGEVVLPIVVRTLHGLDPLDEFPQDLHLLHPPASPGLRSLAPPPPARPPQSPLRFPQLALPARPSRPPPAPAAPSSSPPP